MRSAPRGRRTSNVEVTHVSASGFWLLLDKREVFAPFREFPWFRGATIGQLLTVERPRPGHLHGPELDIDRALESLDHEEDSPLLCQVRPGQGPVAVTLTQGFNTVGAAVRAS
jgi:hypothetical protein